MADEPNTPTPPGDGTPNPEQAPASGGASNTPPAVDEAAVRADAQRAFGEQLKAITGAESLDALKAQHKQAEADRLKQQGEFQKLAEQHGAERDTFRDLYHGAKVEAAITAAATDAVDPATVHALLADQAKVGDDGSVTIGGKPAADAVADLLKDKPFLARASGGQGSGSPGGGGDADAQAKADYEAAKKAGDVPAMLAAKNKMTEA